SPATLYLYCGEQFDPDLGFYYLRARYLNPNSGRFWTMDTYEGDQEEPLSLHKYLYGADNPVNNIDPSGHDFEALDVGEDLASFDSFSAGAAAPVAARATADVHFDRLGSAFGRKYYH